MGLRAALLFSVLLPCVPVCFFRPFVGVILWTIISFASPQRYAWGAAETLPSAELIAVPTILGFLVFSGGWKRLISRESVLIMIFWAWTIVTSINASLNPIFALHADLTWIRFQVVSKILLMTMVTIGIVDSFGRLKTFVITIAACFSFYVVKAIPFMIASAGSYRLHGPPKSAVEDNNDLGLALNMTLPLLLFLAQTETHPRLKRLFWFLFLVLFPGIFCTYSRGALVGLVAVIGLMLIQLKQRAVLIPALLLAIAIAVVFAPQQWKERMNLTNEETTLDKSAMSRINAWTFAWNLVNDYPVAGGGFDTFQRYLFQRYAPDNSDVHGPHSVYFGVLGEHGFVGLGLYLTLVCSCFMSLRRIIKGARARGDDIAEAYAHMFQFSLVAFLTCGLFLGRAYFDYYFTLVACLVILKRACLSAWREGRLVGSQEQESEEEIEVPAVEPGYAVN